MKIDGIIAQSLASLDQASWRRLRIFGCKLPLVVLFAVVFAAPRGYPVVGAMAFSSVGKLLLQRCRRCFNGTR
jgi:hypothetical protein